MKCSKGINRINNPPYCDCIRGYHDKNGQSKNC